MKTTAKSTKKRPAKPAPFNEGEMLVELIKVVQKYHKYFFRTNASNRIAIVLETTKELVLQGRVHQDY
jgi:hypothetical protein